MSPSTFRRLYARMFDLPDETIELDANAVEWIRVHEPRYLAWLGGATQRNARRIRQIGWVGIGVAVFIAGGAIWRQTSAGEPNPFLPAGMDLLYVFIAGWLVGLGWQGVRLGQALALLAILRGEHVDRPRPQVSGSPASSSTSSRNSRSMPTKP